MMQTTVTQAEIENVRCSTVRLMGVLNCDYIDVRKLNDGPVTHIHLKNAVLFPCFERFRHARRLARRDLAWAARRAAAIC